MIGGGGGEGEGGRRDGGRGGTSRLWLNWREMLGRGETWSV